MPTKAKNQNLQLGLFARLGKKLDDGILWIRKNAIKTKFAYRSLNSDYVKNIREHKLFRVLPPSLIMLAFFLILLPFLTTQVVENSALLWDAMAESAARGSVVTPQALSSGEFSQSIDSSSWNNISQIGVLFGTYDRHNHSDYELLIKQDDRVIYSQTFSALLLKDNQYNYFNFRPIQIDQSSRYSVIVRAVNVPENQAVALYFDNDTGDMIFCASGRSDLYGIAIIASVVFLVLFCCINYLINSDKIKSEFHFLACMLVYIIPLVFIYPAFTVPDESYHFLSALRVAEYDLSESPHVNLSRNEQNLPANSDCLSTYFKSMDTPGLVPFHEIGECFNSSPNAYDQYFDAGATSRSLAYLPAALGAKIGDFLSDSPMVIFYFGRVFNLAMVSGILILALSLIKKHRMILLAVVFIPMFLQQAISYSYDGLLNALCLLIIAYEMRFLLTDAKIRKKDIVLMALALAFIGLIKPPYIIIAAPLLAIKSEKFSHHKATKWALILTLLAISALSYILSVRLEAIGAGNISTAAIDEAERGFPLESLFHPFEVLKMFLRTLRDYGSFYVASTIGFFGWFSFSFHPAIIIAYIVFLVVIILSGNENRLKKPVRVNLFLTALAIAGSCFLAMYLMWTPRGSRIIEGVQGRYFLPCIPLLILALMPKQQKINLSDSSCYTFFNLIMLCYIITLLVGFY